MGGDYGRLTQRQLFRHAAATIQGMDLGELFSEEVHELATDEEIEDMDRIQRFLIQKIGNMRRVGRAHDGR